MFFMLRYALWASRARSKIDLMKLVYIQLYANIIFFHFTKSDLYQLGPSFCFCAYFFSLFIYLRFVNKGENNNATNLSLV